MSPLSASSPTPRTPARCSPQIQRMSRETRSQKSRGPAARATRQDPGRRDIRLHRAGQRRHRRRPARGHPARGPRRAAAARYGQHGGLPAAAARAVGRRNLEGLERRPAQCEMCEQHEQHQEYGHPDDQDAEFVDAAFEGRRRLPIGEGSGAHVCGVDVQLTRPRSEPPIVRQTIEITGTSEPPLFVPDVFPTSDCEIQIALRLRTA